MGKLILKKLLPCVGSFSGNIKAAAELGGEGNCMLSEVLAVLNVHGFDKDAAVFSDFYHMSKADDCPYTKRQPIDIEAVVRREGN
jgi:hypothetical protein